MFRIYLPFAHTTSRSRSSILKIDHRPPQSCEFFSERLGPLAVLLRATRQQSERCHELAVTKLLAEREGIASLHVSDLSSLRAHHVAFQEP
jgi:hypothetical protein